MDVGAEGLPFVFRAFEQLGAFASIEALLDGDRWLANADGRTLARSLERPGAMAVIRFP